MRQRGACNVEASPEVCTIAVCRERPFLAELRRSPKARCRATYPDGDRRFPDPFRPVINETTSVSAANTRPDTQSTRLRADRCFGQRDRSNAKLGLIGRPLIGILRLYQLE